MNIKNIFTRKAVLLVVMSISIITGFSFSNVAADAVSDRLEEKTVEVKVDFSRFTIESRLEDAIKDELQNISWKVFAGTEFVITDVRQLHGESIISVASLNGPDSNGKYIGQGESSTILVGKLDKDKGWEVAIMGDTKFSKLINKLSDATVPSEGKQKLNNQSARRTREPSPKSGLINRVGAQGTITTVGYKFPWSNGLSWGFWSTWYHGGSSDCQGTVCSIDLGTTGSDRRVLAATGGTVGPICTGLLTRNVTIYGNDGITLQYYHIDKTTLRSGIATGQPIGQGQVIGSLRTGNFGPWEEEGCGEAYQNDISSHLHWIIPKNVNLSIQGWSILFPTVYWQKPGQQAIYAPNTNTPFISENIPVEGMSCGQANITIQGVIINTGSSLNCNAVESITVLPNTNFNFGSEVNLFIN